MSDRSHIEWTDATWNPIRARLADGTVGWGCQRVSPGCQNCYAATINHRLGTGLDYDAKGIAAAEHFLDEKALVKPLHWRKPRRIFVGSMTDIFGAWVPDGWLDRLFAVMALAPQHTFQLLSKRPERMREYVGAEAIEVVDQHGKPLGVRPVNRGTKVLWAAQSMAEENKLPKGMAFPWSDDFVNGEPFDWPLANVWLGTSVEDQAQADVRIPELLATPAAVRFLSCEPLLGPVDLTGMDCWWLQPVRPGHMRGLEWVIWGGESGPKARACDIGWIRSGVAQCRAAEVACFVKQLGSRPVTRGELAKFDWPNGTVHRGDEAVLKSRKGSDMEEWPADLRVREMPRC